MKRYVFIVGLLLALLAPPGRSADDLSQRIRDGGVIDAQNGDTINDQSVSSAEGVVLNINGAVTGTATSVSMNSSTIDIDGSGSSLTLNDATLTINNGSVSITDAGELSVKDLVISGADFGITNSTATATGQVTMRPGVIAKLNADGTLKGGSFDITNSVIEMNAADSTIEVTGTTDAILSVKELSNIIARGNSDTTAFSRDGTQRIIDFSNANGARKFELLSNSEIFVDSADILIKGPPVERGTTVNLNGRLLFAGSGRDAGNERNIGTINLNDGYAKRNIQGSLGSSAEIRLEGSLLQSMITQKHARMEYYQSAAGGSMTAEQAKAAYENSNRLKDAAILINYSGSGSNIPADDTNAHTPGEGLYRDRWETQNGTNSTSITNTPLNNSADITKNGENSNGFGHYYMDVAVSTDYDTGTSNYTAHGSLQHPTSFTIKAPNTEKYMDYSAYLGESVTIYDNTNPLVFGTMIGSGGASNINVNYNGPNHNGKGKTVTTLLGEYTFTTGNNLREDNGHTYEYQHISHFSRSDASPSGYTNWSPNYHTWKLQNITQDALDKQLGYMGTDGYAYWYCWGDMNDLFVYRIRSEVDFSRRGDPDENWKNFNNNVDKLYGLRTVSPGFVLALFENAAYHSGLEPYEPNAPAPFPSTENPSLWLNEAYRHHRLGPDGSVAGDFNDNFLYAPFYTNTERGVYGERFTSTDVDNITHDFVYTRGLTEFYMGSTLLKVIQVNQDTARMNMGALGSRFDWIHRQFMRPILPPSGLPRTPDEQDPDMPKLLMSQKEKDRASQEAKAIETQAALASPIIHNYSSKVFNRIWLNALGTSERAGFFGEKDVSGREIAGYRYDTGGFILGYDHEHGDATYGGAFSFQHGSYRDLIMDYNNSKLQNYAISFYGTHSSFDEWYLNWIVGYSYANNKLNFGSGGADYKQDFETDTVYAQAMWGSDCWLIDHPTRSLRLTPSFGVGYIRTSSADHTANNTTIKADTHRFDIHRLGTGYLPASLELVFETDTYRGGNFSFSLIGGYQYNFSKKHASGSLTLLGMNGHAATYKTWGRQRRNRHTWNAGARVNYTARRWEVGLSYDFFKRNDSHAHLFNGNFGVFF